MAKFDVDVGGVTYEVDAPDENTAWKWANQTHAQEFGSGSTEKPQLSQEQIAKQKKAATLSLLRGQRGPMQNVAADIAAGASSIGSRILDIPSKMFDAPWIRSELGAESLGADPKSAAYIVGSLFDPVAQATGAGMFSAAARVPAIPKMSQAASEYAKQVLAGGATGAALSGIQGQSPVEGGAVGAGLTAVLANPALGRMVASLSEGGRGILNSLHAVISKNGRTTVGQKMILDNLPEAERATVMRVLQSSGMDTSDLGSPLTTSQILGKSRIGQQTKSAAGSQLVQLEQELARKQGGEQLKNIAEQQRGLQQEMLGTLSGGRNAAVDPLLGMSADDVAIANMRAARTANARRLYPTGEVTGDRSLNEIMSRPGVQAAMGIEAQSASNVPRVTQIGIDKPAKTVHQNVFTEWQMAPYKEELPEVFAKYSIKSLQNQYRLMDKEITRLMKTGASTDETRAYELISAKKDLGSWLSEKSPDWAQANRIFASQSVPVRQAEVGTLLRSQFEKSPKTFLESTGSIPAQGRLIKRETGRPDMALTDVFNLGQMSKISGLRNEAQIAQEVEKLSAMSRANLGDETAFQLPNLLNVWIAVANKIARKTADATVDDVTRAAADVLSNPQRLRALLAEDAASRVTRGTGLRSVSPYAVSGVSNARGMMTGEQP